MDEHDLENVIETLEILTDGLSAKDQDKSFEAVTVLLMQCMHLLDGEQAFSDTVFPRLNEMKNRIQAGHYDHAYRTASTLLVGFRSLRKGMEEPPI